MTILYYTWRENSENDMMNSLQQLGHDVIKCYLPFQYNADSDAVRQVKNLLTKKKCQ